jgi:hypothetical protein
VAGSGSVAAGGAPLVRDRGRPPLRGLAGGRGIHLKGGFGFGEAIYGLSDIHMIVVLDGSAAHPGAEHEAAQRCWRRVRGLLPPLAKLFRLWICEEAELRELERDTYLTSGLRHTRGGAGARAAFLGSHAPRVQDMPNCQRTERVRPTQRCKDLQCPGCLGGLQDRSTSATVSWQSSSADRGQSGSR